MNWTRQNRPNGHLHGRGKAWKLKKVQPKSGSEVRIGSTVKQAYSNILCFQVNETDAVVVDPVPEPPQTEQRVEAEADSSAKPEAHRKILQSSPFIDPFVAGEIWLQNYYSWSSFCNWTPVNPLCKRDPTRQVRTFISRFQIRTERCSRYVLANDLSPAAVAAMTRNIELNGLGPEKESQESSEKKAKPSLGKVRVNEGDAWWTW